MQTLDEALDVRRKAVFFIGSPGSGKSTMVHLVAKGLGFRNVDGDFVFEKMMQARGLSLKMPDYEADERDEIRQDAMDATSAMRDMHVDLGLGIAMDTTGSNRTMIRDLKSWLEQAGYDCRMIYVRTSLKTALERNERRYRTIPPDIVKNHWMGANANADYYRNLFGDDSFATIDNEGEVDTNSPQVLSAYRWLFRWAAQTSKLRESVDTDVDAGNLASRAFSLLALAIEKETKGEGLPAAELPAMRGTKVVPYYPGARLRWYDDADPEIVALFKNLVIGFDPESKNSFYTTDTLLGRGFTHVILMRYSPKDFCGSLKARSAFRHEFIHMLDEMRLKDRSYEPKYSANIDLGSSAWLKQYFSNPSEFNAYFHGLTDNITSFMRDAATVPDDQIEDLKDLYLGPNFEAYLKNYLSTERATFVSFMKNADPSYRKKMLKRLVVLYRAAEELVASRLKLPPKSRTLPESR